MDLMSGYVGEFMWIGHHLNDHRQLRDGYIKLLAAGVPLGTWKDMRRKWVLRNIHIIIMIK